MVEIYRAIGSKYGGRGEEGLRARSNLLTLLPGETREALHSALLRKVEGGDTGLMEDYILTIIIGREYERAVSAIEESGLDLTSVLDETVAWVAWAYFKTGRIEQAKGYYKGILSSNPGYLRAELGLAYCLAVEGDDDAAMKILDRLSVAEDDNIEVHLARAFAHEKAGRYLNAIEEYNRIIALAPENRTAQRLRLQAMSDLGMTTEAIEIATRELPDDRDLHDNLRGDQVLDHFYWGEPDKALAILTPLLQDEKNLRARFDSVVILAEEGDHKEAVEVYENLIEEGTTPPPWLLPVIAEAYLALGEFSHALSLYENALEEDPDSFPLQMGRFYALQGLREWEKAEELLDVIDAGQPAVYWTGDAARPNWNKLEVALARGWLLADQGRLRESEEHFRRLREQAPANGGIRSGLAHVYLWRGWPRKALREFSVIESRDPENVDILTGKIDALNEGGFKREARDTAAALQADHPVNMHVKDLARQLEVEEMEEVNFAFSFTREEDGTKEARANTTFSHHLSLQTRLYAFLFWQKNWNDNLKSYFRRAGLGADYLLNTSWRIQQHFAVNYDDGGDFGSFSLVDYHPDDYWRFELSHDSFTTDVPTRARVFDIGATKTVFDATYRESDWRSYSLSLSTMRFSDDNQRDGALARYEQGLWTKGDWSMRGMLDIYSSRNSLDTAPYFNPSSDFSLSVTHLTEQVLRRSQSSSLLHRLYLTLGAYNQSGFSGGLVGAVKYEREYEFSDVNALLLGAALARNVYDGEGVNSYTLSLNYTGRF